ncbi:unnamed protein product [Adineta steineri]|uniref:Uncharacterized protein n=2 Tax=Adineta steineri TaxID=433720 RepID=A0A815Z1C5_9BILA|nr:unnamed protein product [Adineta steineri]
MKVNELHGKYIGPHNTLRELQLEMFSDEGEIDKSTENKGVNDPKYRAEEIFLMGDASDNKITRKEFIFACKDEPVLCRLRVQDV